MENIQKRQNMIFKRMFATILALVILVSEVFGVADFSANAAHLLTLSQNSNYEFYVDNSSNKGVYSTNSSYILSKTNLDGFYLEQHLSPEDLLASKSVMNQSEMGNYLVSMNGSLTKKVTTLRQTIIDKTIDLLDLDGKTDYEKIRAISAYLNTQMYYQVTFNTGEIITGLYSLTGACFTHAVAFVALCNACNIECYYVSSDLKNHAWNIVKYNEKYYFVDSTNDKLGKLCSPTLVGDEKVYSLNISSNYFYCLSSSTQDYSDWAKTHAIATEDYYVSLASTTQDVSISSTPVTTDNFLKVSYPSVSNGKYYVLRYLSNEYSAQVDGNSFYVYLGNFISGKEYTFQLYVYNEYGELIGSSDKITKTFTANQLPESEDEADAAHSFVYSKTIREATYTNKGAKLYKCKYCDAEKMVYTDKLTCSSHNYSKSVVTKAATCKAAGVRTYTCSICGATKTETIAKLAHSYTNVITKATTKKNGSITPTCSCGATQSSTTIYKIKSVTLSRTKYTYNGKAKKPTVTVKDSKGNVISSDYYTVTYSKGRKSVGSYTVKVKFKTNYSGTVKKTFTIKPKSTSIKKVTAKSKGFKVTWKKVTKQTTGYQIQYATNKKFTKNKKTVTVKKNTTTSKTIKSLKAKKKYYVRVRTYKTVSGKKYYSSWSKVKSVTTKK